ncbi:MAG TPA: lysophospholipid acyltransferase family protein [Rhodanobacteraceae bacterium]|nr:lysophospholipid acyltransferase family protein [Rhodanobacteraceae bacterium]
MPGNRFGSNAVRLAWRRQALTLGALRCAWRFPLLLLVAFAGCLAAIPLLPRGPRPGTAGAALLRNWSRIFLRVAGVRVRRMGEPLHDPVMFVANHGSWMDITVLHAVRPADFVAKAEIGRWPLVGWMARRGGTIFHQRGSTNSLVAVMAVMSDRLRAGRSIAAFPEGGTAPPGTLKVFHPRILQAALDAAAPVQPVALRYLRDGQPSLEVLFTPGESFMHNVFRVLATRSLTAEVHFLNPVIFEPEGGRRRMAETARAEIAQVLGVAA